MAFIDVIKYEGSNNILVWKHPIEDFNTAAQLIVHESQEAIVFKDGEASEPYKSGKYTIESDNIPGIRRVVGLVTGGPSPNHCEVYFINMANSMNIYWGTPTPWTVQDPSLQIPFDMRAHGSFAVKVMDSRQLLRKLVGTMTSFTQQNITDYFRGQLVSRIKDSVSNAMFEEQIGYAEVSSRLSTLSEKVSGSLAKVVEKYGLALEEFAIESITVIKDDVLEQVRRAQGVRAKNIIIGVTEQEKMGYEVAKAQAQNPGTGGQMGQIMTGIAAGAAVAPAIGGMVRNVMQPVNNSGNNSPAHPDQFSIGAITQRRERVEQTDCTCPSCRKTVPAGSRFCNYCGASVNAKPSDLTCPICGNKVPSGSKFCNGCGNKL